MKTFLRLGLTGGIASGKSTVAEMLRELGCGVVDADRISREVVSPGSEGLARVKEAFGREVLTPTGALDRDAMRRAVFCDSHKRKLLESLIHPLIHARIARAMEDFSKRGFDTGVVEAALLLETSASYDLDAVIAVVCGRRVQEARLRARGGWSDEEIKGVLDAQGKDEERKGKADYLLENRGTKEELRDAVGRLWKILEKEQRPAIGRGRE